MTFETDTVKRTPSGDSAMANAEMHKLACANCGTPLSTNYGKTALICTYCGQRHRFLEPPQDAGDQQHAIGDTVAVEWGGLWWSAHVVDTMVTDTGEKQWKIHFEGWAPAFDDTVDATRIRTIDYEPGNSIIPPPYQAEPLEVKRNNPIPAIIGIVAMVIGIGLALSWSLSKPSTDVAQTTMKAGTMGMVQGPVSAVRVTEDTPLRAGQRFHVLWDNDWYMGTAMHVDPSNGEVIIRYDGWNEQYDELVPRDRLRLIK